MVNLTWAHQKLNFKDGAYKIRYQGSPDLLVMERSHKALIGMNDNNSDTLKAWVQKLLAKLTKNTEKPIRAYLKVEYQAPAKSTKF